MSLAPRLDLRQSQSLVMTPQLQQAIKLLALSNPRDRGGRRRGDREEPLLELAPNDDGGPEPVAEAVRDEPAGADELVMSGEAAGESLDVDIVAERFDDASADRMGMDGAMGMNGLAGPGWRGRPRPRPPSPAATATLADHLRAQIGALVSGVDLLIAEHLIDQIDDTATSPPLLTRSPPASASPPPRSSASSRWSRPLDPTGVGARDLAECLALQAKEADRFDPCMAKLIGNLDLLAAAELARLKRMCGVDDEDMADMIRELRAYDPKPGCRYGGEPARAVTPDLYVARTKSGWAIELNGATLPRVLVNRGY